MGTRVPVVLFSRDRDHSPDSTLFDAQTASLIRVAPLLNMDMCANGGR